MNQTIRRAVLALAVGASLSGCASLAPRAGDQAINALLATRQGPAVAWSTVNQPAAEQQAIEQWLAAPMTAASAVRVAMLRSPRLQQEYARLGLARAEVLDAVQIGNPRLSLSRRSLDPGPGTNRIADLSLPLADLLVLPTRARLAKAEYQRAQLEIAGAVLGVAADVEAAWYSYVGAQQVAGMRRAVAEGAAVSAELAQRFFDAGNISELQLKQEQAAASEARIDAANARAEAGRTRLALNTLIGLSGNDTEWATSDRLPVPVASEDDPAQLAKMARSSNLELLAARQQVDILADALGITRRFGWLGSSEIGYERETEVSGERLRGPTLNLELPIFNQGQAKVARAEALLAGARARVAMAELGADNAIRLGAQQVRDLSEVVAIHRDALIPQRETVVKRSQQEQNFMLIGVFELIQAKVKEYDAYEGYLVAVRDYWRARVELMRAVGQRLPSDASIDARTPSVQDILTPSADEAMPGMDHSGHDMPTMPGMDHRGHDMSGKAETPSAPPVDRSQHRMPTEVPTTPEPQSAPEDDAKDTTTPPIEDHSDHGDTP
jgi:outer membrane protein TolC